MLNRQPLILDVRTPEEYAEGHICGATLIPTPKPPLTEDDWYVLLDYIIVETVGLPKWWPIYVYCKKGIRATEAVDILRNVREFQNVHNLGGVDMEPLKSFLESGAIRRCRGVYTIRPAFKPRVASRRLHPNL